MDKEHVNKKECMTDELDSDAKDDNGDDRPNVVRFNEEDEITKEYKLKVGMEFSSLKHFKSAILEHNVLNERNVRFGKNYAVRCRVVCKEKSQCNYTIILKGLGRHPEDPVVLTKEDTSK
ncbi:unnamed protein product [Lathyrus sativus]|nr:unnamed protein product [Lathyrus sativus]